MMTHDERQAAYNWIHSFPGNIDGQHSTWLGKALDHIKELDGLLRELWTRVDGANCNGEGSESWNEMAKRIEAALQGEPNAAET